jgi:23S rRNA pseudouridine1911/1915/1917 synthase
LPLSHSGTVSLYPTALLGSEPDLVKTSLPHWIVTSQEQGLRLDRFLAVPGRLGSRGRVRTALERGQVFFNDAEASVKDAGVPLASGDTVRIWLDRPGSSRRKGGFEASGLHILYEDETLLVVNKPAGLLAVPLGRGTPSRSAYSLLADHLGSRARRTPFIVHRIDRDTSGIVVFAKTAAAQQAIKDQFARRQPERVYWALVHGLLHPSRGRWRDHLAWDDDALRQTVTGAKDPRGVEAISDYRVLETFGEASLVEVRLHTGKRNQIRIQAAVRGHPLVGERQYTGGLSTGTGRTHPRQALHAHRLAFAHPIDGRKLTFEAPLPDDLQDLLRRLRGAGHKATRA